MRYDTILFDLDGTLLDTIDDLGTAVNHALTLRGLPLHTLAEYRMMVGGGIRKLNYNALPAALREDSAYLDACLADFLAYYTEHIDVHTHPYPGMRELVNELAQNGAAIAVTSNKFQAGAEKLIREFFPGVDFVAVFGNRPGAPLKPDPAIVGDVLALAAESGSADSQACPPAEQLAPSVALAAERNAKLSPAVLDRTVLVGDSGTDIKTAANAGIHSIAVSWGFRPREELADAQIIVDTPEELRRLLLD